MRPHDVADLRNRFELGMVLQRCSFSFKKRKLGSLVCYQLQQLRKRSASCWLDPSGLVFLARKNVFHIFRYNYRGMNDYRCDGCARRTGTQGTLARNSKGHLQGIQVDRAVGHGA
jgi:hypothetical protein